MSHRGAWCNFAFHGGAELGSGFSKLLLQLDDLLLQPGDALLLLLLLLLLLVQW